MHPEAFGYKSTRNVPEYNHSRELNANDVALGAHLLTTVAEPVARTGASAYEQHKRGGASAEHNAKLDERRALAAAMLAKGAGGGPQSAVPSASAGGPASDLLPNDYAQTDQSADLLPDNYGQSYHERLMSLADRIGKSQDPHEQAGLQAELKSFGGSQKAPDLAALAQQRYQLQHSATRPAAMTLQGSPAQQLGMAPDDSPYSPRLARPHAAGIQADLAQGQQTTAPADVRLHGQTDLSPMAQAALNRYNPPPPESDLVDNARSPAGHEAVRQFNLKRDPTQTSSGERSASSGSASGNAQPAMASGPVAVTDHGGLTIDPERAYSSRELQVLAEQAHAIQDPAARAAATDAVRKAAGHELAFHDVSGQTWGDLLGTENSAVGQHRAHVLGIMHEKPVDPLLQDRHDRLRQQIDSGKSKTLADAARLKIMESKSLTQKEKDESLTRLHDLQSIKLTGDIDEQTYVTRIKQIDADTEARHRESEIARNHGQANQDNQSARRSRVLLPSDKANNEAKPGAAKNAEGTPGETPGQKQTNTNEAIGTEKKQSDLPTPAGLDAPSANPAERKMADKKGLKKADGTPSRVGTSGKTISEDRKAKDKAGWEGKEAKAQGYLDATKDMAGDPKVDNDRAHAEASLKEAKKHLGKK